MVSVTSAIPRALRSRVPAKITSCICEPRRDLALCSPRTQLTPSRMLDLPQPFGPTTTAMPVPGTVNSVRSQKLLNPRMCIFFSFSMFSPSGGAAQHCTQESGSSVPSQPGGKLATAFRLYLQTVSSLGAGSTARGGFLWIREAGILLLLKSQQGCADWDFLISIAAFIHRSWRAVRCGFAFAWVDRKAENAFRVAEYFAK